MKPADISQANTVPNTLSAYALDLASSIEKDIPSRIGGTNRVFMRAVIARALSDAYARGLEDAAVCADERSQGWSEQCTKAAIDGLNRRSIELQQMTLAGLQISEAIRALGSK